MAPTVAHYGLIMFTVALEEEGEAVLSTLGTEGLAHLIRGVVEAIMRAFTSHAFRKDTGDAVGAFEGIMRTGLLVLGKRGARVARAVAMVLNEALPQRFCTRVVEAMRKGVEFRAVGGVGGAFVGPTKMFALIFVGTEALIFRSALDTTGDQANEAT